jgi:hypothetical protein
MNRIAFVVTTSGNDYFSLMTRLALASLRLTNPAARILVCCDQPSKDAMQRVDDRLLLEADEVLAFDTPPGTPEFRNRFVKTNLRNLITEKFLFLDSDILVRGDLAPLFDITADIAGSRNHSRLLLKDQIWSADEQVLKVMNWQVRNDVYVNGGVLFFNETQAAYSVTTRWHQNWLAGFHQHKNYRDQPALNNGIFETQAKLEVLPDSYNAQFKRNIPVASNAIVWHFYASANSKPITGFEVLLSQACKTNSISQEAVLSLIQRNHPWKQESIMDGWMAARIAKVKKIEPWVEAWLAGNKAEATQGMLKYLFTRMRK